MRRHVYEASLYLTLLYADDTTTFSDNETFF